MFFEVQYELVEGMKERKGKKNPKTFSLSTKHDLSD